MGIGLLLAPTAPLSDVERSLIPECAHVRSHRSPQRRPRTFVTQTIVPFLASEGVPLDRAYGTIGSWPESVPFLDPPPMGYGRLFRNPEFISLAQFKLSWEHVSVREYEEALSRATQIISLINRELGDK